MSQDVTVRQGDGPSDRWEAMRCQECNARLFDLDRKRRQVGIRCRRCRHHHVIGMDARTEQQP